MACRRIGASAWLLRESRAEKKHVQDKMAAYSEIPLESLTAGDVYVTGDAAAKREAVEMLRSGRAGGTPRGEPSPQVELLEEEEAREEEALAA